MQRGLSDFREARPTATGRLISDIHNVLMQIDLVKAQSMSFPALIRDEIRNTFRSGLDNVKFGVMLHLLHARLQQTD